MEEIEEVMTKLEELVLEENRIVTLKALSQCCGIDILKAKKIMEDFHQKNKDNLSACYIIWGYKNINDEKATLFVLSRENELVKTKASFTEVLNCQIYSISKTVPKDIGDIYSNEVALRKQCSKTVPPRICESRIKFKETTKSPIKSVILNQEKTSVGFPKSFEANKPTKSNQSSAIADAFAKTSKTHSTTHDTVQKKFEKTNTESKKSQPKDSKNKALGGMMAFVKKGITPSTAKETSKNVPEPKADVKALEKEMWSDSCDEENEEDPIPEKIKKIEVAPIKPVKKMRRIIMASSESEDEEIENVKKIETKKLEDKKLLEDSKYNSNVRHENSGKNKQHFKNVENKKKSLAKEEKKKETKSSKRKASESDNESPFPQPNISIEDDDDEDIIPPTPLQKNIPQGPCLQYQTIRKTFQDEDGFFVTRKEKCLVEVQRLEKDNEDESPPVKDGTKTDTKVDNSKTVTESKKHKTNRKNSNSPLKKQSRLDFFFHKK